MIVFRIKSKDYFNATKAVSDIDKILLDEYKAKSEVIRINDKRPLTKFKKIKPIFKCHFKKELIFMQHPYANYKFIWRLLPKSNTMVLIHDINGLRYNNNSLLNFEIWMIKRYKYVIVHNNEMKRYLIENGISEENIYVLEIFDYLVDEENIKINDYEKSELETIVCFAGNLLKSKFLNQLDENKMNFKMYLYGIGVEKDINSKMQYKGKYEANVLPNYLEGNLGLVWDGNFDESDENDTLKKYMKYNNPHKLSCYVAAGMPVIVWEKSAVANFVKKYNIGYTIKNIYDINNIDFTDYSQKIKNVKDLSEKVRKGFYIKRVVDKILKDMSEERG